MMEYLFKTISNPKELLNWMSENVQYGHPNLNVNRYEEFMEKYYLQTPEELLNSRLGVCWDQVEFERLFFERWSYQFKSIYLIMNLPPMFPSHTCIIYKDEQGWHWFENSFEKYRGINGCYKSEEEAVSAVRKAMAIHYGENRTWWTEFGKPKYGLSCMEYMKHVEGLRG